MPRKRLTFGELFTRSFRKRSQVIADSPAPKRSTAHSSSLHKPMRERYDELVIDMKTKYGIRVRKWRSSTSGCAWEVHYRDGTITRLIESPYPTGPMSCAVFLHEIGHHAIGLQKYRPRCLEEFKAWEWAINTMHAEKLNVTPAVEKRMEESLRYAVRKAVRRGLKRLPAELIPYLDTREARIQIP